MLVPQVYDLFGRLFASAKRLFVSKLKPGLTGAAVVFARPTWNHGMGPAYLVKIGRREKVKLEGQRYDDFVKPYLPPNTTTQVDVTFTQHLGALQYRFAESDIGPFKEFDEFYKGHPTQEIITSLQNLFQNIGRYWYDNPERRFADLPQLYYAAFQLDEVKLHGRIREVLPNFDPEWPFLHLPSHRLSVINPVAWLAEHREECVMAVYHCITHGDLTGRNIMVSEHGRCWLIDFYRTHESHILRDFVILETDIKYRLLPVLDDKTFDQLEHTLLAANPTERDVSTAGTLPPAANKAAEVLLALHRIAYEFLRDRNGAHLDTRREYLISLLMATLNVARLRHIPTARKLQAMLSASFICAELDRLAGRESVEALWKQPIYLDEAARRAWVLGELIPPLSPTEFRLLQALYYRPNEILSNTDLISTGWPNVQGGVSDEALHARISSLRKKIEPDPQHPRFVETIHGQGYKLNIPSDGDAIKMQSPDSNYDRNQETDQEQPIYLDEAAQRAWVLGNLRPPLSAIEFRLLQALYHRPNEILSNDELINAGWLDVRGGVSVEALHALMSSLRKKIEPDFQNPIFLKNIHGQGFKLDITLDLAHDFDYSQKPDTEWERPFYLDEADRRVWVMGKVKPALTSIEFRLLQALYHRPNEILSNIDLISAGWPHDQGGVSAEALYARMSSLRKKIEVDPQTPLFLKNVHGRGYKLDIK